jgi:hypothetical protein
MEIPFDQILKNVALNKLYRHFPEHGDSRARHGLLWPHLTPRFTISRETMPKVFTIGSCFARNIEEALEPLGFDIPTRRFSVPEEERGGPKRPNGLLNEFNPGTMQQRILNALEGRPLGTGTLVPSGTMWTDLLLPGGTGVSLERALARRAEITSLYRSLLDCQCVIITLGLVEAWYDREENVFINQMPSFPWLKAHPTRYSMFQLDVKECVDLLAPAMAALAKHGINVLLTVSPVPLQTTMLTVDCGMSNEFSKATLRTCAEELRHRYSNVDYFPSYEIVRSGGLQSYDDDHVHVKSQVVAHVTEFMVQQYCTRKDIAAA